jgi:aminoglycoside N3'-acetyltransferase
MTEGPNPSGGGDPASDASHALGEEILAGFRRVLPSAPGIAVIHSSFPLLVPPRGFVPADALYAVAGLVESGWTVALPAFTFSFCGTGRFEIGSKSETGLFADWLRTHFPDAIRTPHPIYSFVVRGPRAAEIAACPSSTTFGDDSPFGLFEREDARMVMLGCGWESCTQTHRYEELARVPYRYFKTFRGQADHGGGPRSVTACMFVRDLEIDAINDLAAIEPALRERGAIASAPLFRGAVEAVATSALARTTMAALAENPYAVVRDGERVADAVAARMPGAGAIFSQKTGES